MKKTYWSGFLAGILCTILCITIGLGGQQLIRYRNLVSEVEMQGTEETGKTRISPVSVLTKVNLLQKYIDLYYLNEVEGSELENGMFKGIVWGLADPYSAYYTKEEYAAVQESSSGIYCGIGATVNQNVKTKEIIIVDPFVGGPAADAGILPGDIVYKVDKELVEGKDLSEVVAKMKGKEGTKVKITVLRGKKKVETEVTRRTVTNPTITYEMLDNQIGYIKIREFDEVTTEQFRNALNDLEKQGESSLIIDLRNNGGGRLTAAVDMLDRMLPEGVIVSTKEKSGEGETFLSTDEEKFEKPLMVLINEHSASASEVFAGAIQDYGIGKLVGTKSFGKGIVQTIYGLEDGTAIKLTTSEYFTPKGRNIHGSGLVPDIEVKMNKDLEKKIVIEKKEDNQLNTAIKEIMKK